MTEFKTLTDFATWARERAALVQQATEEYGLFRRFDVTREWEHQYLLADPNEDTCRWCRAQSTCPAMARKIQETVGAGFDVILENQPVSPTESSADRLSQAMAAAGLIEDWIKAVRAEVERRLLAGTPVEGFGLELGREGARKWSDPALAEEMLRTKYRLTMEDSYDMKVISPTTAEKLLKKLDKKGLKPLLNKKQWAGLQALVVRSPAVPSVKPVGEIKTPWNVSDDFLPVKESE